MPDSMMYHEDNYVVLPPSMQEQFVKLPELEDILRGLLAQNQDRLPVDLQKFPSIEQQVECLIKTACEFESEDGTWQWFVVRLEKPKGK